MRKYFLSVQTYSNTTKLGKLVADIIEPKYNNTVVSENQLLRIPNEIEDIMYQQIQGNPRLKPMTTSVYGFIRGIAGKLNMTKIADSVNIWIWSSVSGDNDNRPFTIYATKIRRDYSELRYKVPENAKTCIYTPKKKGGDR